MTTALICCALLIMTDSCGEEPIAGDLTPPPPQLINYAPFIIKWTQVCCCCYSYLCWHTCMTLYIILGSWCVCVVPSYFTCIHIKVYFVRKGDFLFLACIAWGNPHPLLSWYHGNTSISEGEILTIKNATFSDIGESIKCT